MNTMIYLVKVKLVDKDMNALRFINERLRDIEVTKAENNYIEFKWDMCEEDGGPHEIEEVMYYTLENNSLGTYDYERIE